MQNREEVKPARERILDAAATVMREKGLAKTTTKLIAAAAGYSEAMLYKHFADKQELFLLVLKERTPSAQLQLETAGSGDLAENLTRIVQQLMEFFVQTFPMAASIFGSPELLAQHRTGVTGRGYGPAGPVLSVEAYLDAERDAGRVAAASNIASVARLLVGVAFHQGFLAAFEGRDDVPSARTKAEEAVAAILPALTREPLR
jgi:AcrR family transcriptional regulator